MPDIECRSRCRPSSPAAAFLPAGQRPLTTAPHFCELTGRTNYGLSKDLGRISRRRCRGGSSVVPSRPAGPTRVRQFVPALVSRRAKPTAGDGCADGVAGDPAKRTCVGKIDGGGGDARWRPASRVPHAPGGVVSGGFATPVPANVSKPRRTRRASGWDTTGAGCAPGASDLHAMLSKGVTCVTAWRGGSLLLMMSFTCSRRNKTYNAMGLAVVHG